MWEEIGAPGGNPRRHVQDMKTRKVNCMGPSTEPVYMWSICDGVLNLPAHAVLLPHKHGWTDVEPHTWTISCQRNLGIAAWLCSNRWLLRSLSFPSWLRKTGSQISHLSFFFVVAVCSGSTFLCIWYLYLYFIYYTVLVNVLKWENAV